ncbi:hypothetical protein [Halorubellus sp. PRR65]|uniref:hypothetical protein n=1 Tax=Halorubellus sp. PRR65 TaxID=3098148 RepID=UPI002B25EE24|nr:hypothetical protein [Halorubellus sp. PRR65]
MSVLSDRRLRWLSVALVLVALAAVGLLGVGTLAVVSAITAASAGDALLLVVLRAALPFLLGLAALSVVGAGLLAWLLVRALRLAELPRSERLERVARGVEGQVPWLAEVNVSDRVAPTVEDRREALVERYASGELTEREFEREMEGLLAEEDAATDWSATNLDDEFDRGFAADLRREDADDDAAGGAGSDADASTGAEGASGDSTSARADAGSADVEHDRR